jgi:L-asparaginase II
MRAARVDDVRRHARPIFAGSAVKLIQALPLIESGAADSSSLADAEIALACTRSTMAAAALRMAMAAILPRAFGCEFRGLSAAGTIRNNREEAVGAILNPFVAPLKSTLSLSSIRDIKHET